MSEIQLPDPTKQAMELVKATKTYRSLHERPLKWTDNRTLVVRASGYVVNPDGSEIPLWYEVDVTYDIEEKKISAASVIEVKPHEG